MVYTFWEGPMPDYIKLCMKTWKFDYVMLDYELASEIIRTNVKQLAQQGYSLPQVADFVRVHVLRDEGGYWLDADTIMLTDELPKEIITGYPDTRANTIGYLHTEKHSDMFIRWADFQNEAVTKNRPKTWDCLGNAFTDSYLLEHPEISIKDVRNCWPETYMIHTDEPRNRKYHQFYFDSSYTLADINKTDMLMLHNSWTPGWYKDYTESQIRHSKCTLSNILMEAL